MNWKFVMDHALIVLILSTKVCMWNAHVTQCYVATLLLFYLKPGYKMQMPLNTDLHTLGDTLEDWGM